jgi:hypothetical protein
MALKNQPYIPLYVQDVLTNVKLLECSAESHGVYFRLICVLHKQDDYGKILLKQKYKQTDEQVNNFALMLVKHIAFDFDTIKRSLAELIDEKVLFLDGDSLCQKRMIEDNKLSEIRANAGKKGGETTFKKSNNEDKKDSNFAQAKSEANTEYEIENEIVIENKDIKETEIKEKAKTLNFHFDTENFKSQWKLWKVYKNKKHKFTYFDEESEQKALTELFNLSNQNEKTATLIIRQSIDKGWKGFFELKDEKPTPPPFVETRLKK